MKSEIFDNFVKIAQDKNIISNDSKKSKDALEKNPRADSLDISAIEALYGVKPKTETPYKNNIMEVAHPSPLVIAPSYDKINGLVENEIERQNINLRIVNKNPDGLLTQRKYAEKEFLLSLVKVANDLDNKNEEQLRKLADHCLETFSEKEMVKNAFWGKLIGWGLGIGLGLATTTSHMDYVAKDFGDATQNLINEIKDMIKSSVTIGFGHKYSDDLIERLNEVVEKLAELKNSYNIIKPIVPLISSKSRVKKVLKDPGYHGRESLEAAGNEIPNFKKLFQQIKLVLEELKEDFQNPSFQKENVEQGTVTKYIESIPGLKGEPLLSGGTFSLFSSKFYDITNAINPVLEIGTYLSDNLQQVYNTAKDKEGQPIPTRKLKKKTRPSEESRTQTSSVKDLDESAKDLTSIF